MERQAINRAARIGQKQTVTVIAPYLISTVDDAHKEKHIFKSDLSILVTGDVHIDDLYKDKMSELRKLEEKFLRESQKNESKKNNSNSDSSNDNQ